ncbi:spermidine/putrescine ABC transporter substrate-binding protein [Chloroflexia bacterium SDU3-3]|nr:spermidine/putrescine ABC transporter substrate-binding protein [Chloroflexia bacterium SDU3-3]
MQYLGVVGAALALLTACGGQGQAGSSATSAPAPAATQAAAPTADGSATAPDQAPGSLAVDPAKLSKELHIYNWADYLDPAVLEDFQKEYGVAVTSESFDNNEDMIAKISPGSSGYDIVFPSDYAIDIMAKGGLLAKLDKSLLPNLANIKADNLDLYYDKGNVYSLPYNMGMTGLAYDSSKFDAPVDSWAAVFDPAQLEKIKGQFTMLDDERETPGAALKYLGLSLNNTNPADLKKAEDLLKAQKPDVSAYDSSNVSRKLASGEIIIGHIYSYNALQARLGLDGSFSGNPNITFVAPKEGCTIWQDNMAIVADSPNQYTAHVFLNYLMRPDVAAKNATFILGVTPNAAAEPLLPPTLQDAYKQGFAPTEEMMKRLEWIERNDQTKAFTDLWTAVKGE